MGFPAFFIFLDSFFEDLKILVKKFHFLIFSVLLFVIDTVAFGAILLFLMIWKSCNLLKKKNVGKS
jgi:hypothetical protein